jgi:transposase
MDAFSLPLDAPLPDDVPALQALVRELLAEVVRLRAENAEVARLRAENTDLKTKLDQALKHRFGRRSERRPKPKPKSGDDDPARARDLHGRAPLPEHLERREVVHDLTEAEKLCPCCGQVRVCIGVQTAEQLDLEPARFFVRRTVKKSYACRHCDPARVPVEQRLQTAGPEQVGPLAKGLCGPGLLAHVITAKFADHTPLHRLAGQLGRSGVSIARSTLGDWLAAAADLLDPLYQLMHRRLLHSRVIHGDDTSVKLRVAGLERTRKAHLWANIGDADYPYVVFDFTADYTAKGPTTFLEGYRGYLQADALAQYEGLYGEERVKHVCCWAHARRKFVAAAEGGDARAEVALERIRQLYAIERELPLLLPPSEEAVTPEQRRQREEQRRQRRQQQAEPILTELKTWLDEERPLALPKSLLGKALGYALNNWEALRRYLEQGYLAIDNNLSERTLRAIALGRNNWGVIGSETGGQTAAVLYTLVGTCKHLGIDPFVYLREALPGIFALGEKPRAEQLLDWLPDRWLHRRGRESPPGEAKAG